MTGRPILTAEAIRAAEQVAIDSGTSVEELMERAGAALAEAVYRFAGPTPALILCGPGNNGGDGYVAARHLAERKVAVRVAATGEPKSAGAKWARSHWRGEVEKVSGDTASAPLLIDCLFGTGLKRGLDNAVSTELSRLCAAAVVKVACDLPSGVESDSGEELGRVPPFDMTVTFGALKPAHRLHPAMHKCGRVVLADIGIAAEDAWHEIAPPSLPPLDPGGHKYDRGLVHALAGTMPGAIALAAKAAARAGAGYVRVSTSKPIDGLPSAIVQLDHAPVSDERIGCLLVGPGLGDIPQVLTLALTSKAPKVIDADGITHLGEPDRLKGQDAIITPHEGEFRKLFGDLPGSKPERALEAAKRSSAVVVYKGPDTLVASPEGKLGFAPNPHPWLASAGTGDVLAGIIAAMRARGLDAFEAACAGVWLHGRAAEIAGHQLIADDLVDAIPKAIAVNEPIVRIAARGDGVTASGRHVPFGVPGDALLDDGALAYGPHHQEPPCRHFPECGGCQLQHADDEAYRDYLMSRVQGALDQHELATEIRPPHLSPPRSRRRTALKVGKAGGNTLVGFNAQMSHRIVDMHECHILRRELFELVSPLRKLLGDMLQPKRIAEVQLTLIHGGVDVLIKGIPAGRLTEIERLTAFAMDYQLARLSIDRGLGPDTLYEPQPAAVILSGTLVAFPHGSFLQATEDGELALIEAVGEATAGSANVADLFAGLGTFALAANARYAAEASRDAAAALKRAAPAIDVDHRDLYRRPLDGGELRSFDAAILDPPRAGAAEQVAMLGASKVAQVAYVSCNPVTFARDAKALVDGGYALRWAQPVGQFRWSTHVELAACFSR